MNTRTIALAAGYLGTIVAANWAVTTFGMVTVWTWPHLLAPAGVWFAGLAFTLRDLLHEVAGRTVVMLAILAGAALSLAVGSHTLAFASAIAFGLSEMADLAVYAPLRRRHWLTAVVLSNTVGLIVDSALFLWLAFGSLAFLPGQVVGKLWMTALAVGILATVRIARTRKAAV